MEKGIVIAKYLRISAEDTDIRKAGKVESNSIGSQRNLIDNFIGRMPEFADADILEFCDDGWSGKNFERPAFKTMLEQMKCGSINCMIVKDLSRFGRDYLTVGNYISHVFPFLGVRFIAINDGLDSAHTMDADSLDILFKTLLYDLYSRDLSYKVRSAKQFKAKRGDFLSPFAPYGYIKAKKNKNQLEVDLESAEIIHWIFKMAADGIRPVQIARILNAKQVLTPMMYKRKIGCSRSEWPCVNRQNFWTENTVIKILCDERYMGKTIYGKRMRDQVGKAHVVSVPQSDWIVVENAHQAIVSKEEFELAKEQLQAYLKHDKIISSRKGTMLYKKVCCGVCGHIMKRVNAKQPYYICSTPRFTDAYSCTKEHILESDLTKIVLKELQIQALYAVESSHIWEEKQQKRRKDIDVTTKMLFQLKQSQTKFDCSMQSLYEKFAFGELDKTAYLRTKRDIVKNHDVVSLQIEKLEAKLKNLNTDKILDNQLTDYLNQCTEIEKLINEIAPDVLEKIVVYPDNAFCIIWNYQENLRQLFLDS